MLHIGGFYQMTIREIEFKYLEIKKKLQEENSVYTEPYIKRQLNEKDNLRKVFISIIKHNPALINEVSKDALLSKPTCYSQLHKLLELKLVVRKYVEEAEKEKDKEIMKKFNDWTSKMPENLKRYFKAKASFWKITDLGKQFSEWAYLRYKDYKEKEVK